MGQTAYILWSSVAPRTLSTDRTPASFTLPADWCIVVGMVEHPPSTGVLRFFWELLKALFVDQIFGSFATEDKATATINRVTPLLYVVGAIWALVQGFHQDGTIEHTLGGLAVLVAGILVHWRKSRFGAAVILVYALYLPFSFDLDSFEWSGEWSGLADTMGTLVFYVTVVICAILACRGAWAYQRIRKEDRRHLAELIAAQGDRAEAAQARPRGFKAHLESEKAIKANTTKGQ